MERLMMKILASFAAALALAAQTPDVTGTWNMGVQGDHVIPMALVLKQQDTHVTGTIAMPTNQSGDRIDVPLSGELVEHRLTLSGTFEREKEPVKIELEATLKDDGSLEGTAMTPHGKMSWTAERLKPRK